MTQKEHQDGMAAEAYISRLGERGIEYVFANAGTDFAPIVEALSHQKGNGKVPRFMVVPHENVAMAMAHGYYRIAGKPAAVMVHVTVGTANTLNGVINASRDNIPVLLAAGRTPITETGSIASRNRPIHWGQEVVRPGRHAARIREMGLRAARRPAGRGGGRPRARHRDERAARAGVPDTAARGPQRPERSHAPQHGASARLVRARTRAGGDRGGDAADRQGRVPAHRHLGGRTGRGVRSANSPRWRRNSRSRWCSRKRAT